MRVQPILLPALMAGLLTGCWKTDLAELSQQSVAFAPEAEGAPDGWLVTPFEVPVLCPNGERARFYFLYPEEAVDGDTPIPAAVVYHSGAFDFVYAPSSTDPLAGTHYAAPSRLDSEWAIRNVFVTLGMLPEETEDEEHTGVLPIALAEEGIAMMLPANCWGDWWHNRSGQADNDFATDLFTRDGRAAAEWGYQFLVDPILAAGFFVELPVQVDTSEIYVIGLGEGGRAVTELLSVDEDGDGVADYQPAGALVDSVADDLNVFFTDPSRYGNAIAGLDRIFPAGQVDNGSLRTASLPDRFGYLYASEDAQVPEAAHLLAMDQLLNDPTKWVYVDNADRHILLNSDDQQLARDAVAYLRTGIVPGPGDGVPIQP